MLFLMQQLETVAARGSAGLSTGARQQLIKALYGLQQDDGGFAGLDGCSDPYFSLFAWLSLRALGSADEHARICVYMAGHCTSKVFVDALCARLLLTLEGQIRPDSWWRALVTRETWSSYQAYGAFFKLLNMVRCPRWFARGLWWFYKQRLQVQVLAHLPTPRLAAGLVLASCAGVAAQNLVKTLVARHVLTGGFSSAPTAAPDLLATAVARFALEIQQQEIRHETQGADLIFIENCWLESGLFGASPAAIKGDAEQTFYGLLALGTCR